MNAYTIIGLISYLIFPYALYVLFKMKLRESFRVFLLIFIAFYIFWHFIEPKMLVITQMKIQTGFTSNFIVVGDVDLGYYKSKEALWNIVNEINALNTDFVLFTGDFTKSQSEDTYQTSQIISSLKDFNTPSFFASEDEDSITKELVNNGVVNLSTQTPKVNNIFLIWIPAGGSANTHAQILKSLKPEDNVLVFMHTPEMIFDFPKDIADLSFASAPWKKIRIPFTNDYIFPSHSPLEKWLYKTDSGRIYVTSGLGESEFPFRLFNPPEIIKVETF